MGDQRLDDDEFSKGPRIYGGVEVDTEERAALDLPPGFSLYEKLDENKMRIDVEECINKLRWNVLCGKVRNDDSDERNETDVRESNGFIDVDEMKINVNRLRATNLPYNTNVKMPQKLKEEEEIRIAKF